MIDALYISENALRVNQNWIESISHNVANINTAAYKRSDVSFSDLVGISSGNSVGMGANIDSSRTDFAMGKLKQTNRQLDFAITGNGFLEVVLPDGEVVYTKNGQLSIGEDRRLRLIDGTELANDILIPEDAVSIKLNSDGNVVVTMADGLQILEVGNLTLVQFANTAALESIGSSRYRATSLSGEPLAAVPGESGIGEIVQGAVEMSNVELVKEMSDVVLAQRAYQLNARLLQISDQVLETINNLRR